MFILHSQQSCQALCSLWLSFPSFQFVPFPAVLFFPHHWQHAGARTWRCLSSCPQVSLCCSPPGKPPAAKQTPGFNCSQIPGWRTLAPERGKEYLKLNAFSATHPRLILSYPRLNSLKHPLPTNRFKQTSQAGRSDKHNVRTGGFDCQASSHLQQISYLFCQDGTHIHTAGKS